MVEVNKKKSNKYDKAILVLFVILALMMISSLISSSWALAIGLIFAIVFGNPMLAVSSKASKLLLQWSVVGLGFGMNLASIWSAGKTGFGFTVATIFGTLTAGLLLGRIMKIEPQISVLISGGTSICGGSAIAAIGAVLNSDQKAMSVSLCTIFLLNAVALFIFPPIGHWLDMDQVHFGLWSAIAIHDTSSVVGAASKYGEDALITATSVKLVRTLWIIPITLGIAFFNSKKNINKVKFPWFIIFFIAAAGLRTLVPQGFAIFDAIKDASKLGLTLTLFLIGAGLSRDAIKTVGFKPMIQGIILWMIISVGGFAAVEMILK